MQGEQAPTPGKQAAGETGDPEPWGYGANVRCRRSPSPLAGIQGKDRKQIAG